MAGLEFLSLLGTPAVAYLFPELDPTKTTRPPLSVKGALDRSSTFVFQYWPSQVQDSYETEYATKLIPGGSTPIYQWVSGSGRTISFEAVFTAEVEDLTPTAGLTALTPSARYTVNVAGAISKLKTFQLPDYKSRGGIVSPPQKLRLVFPNARLGGNVDDILCFLKSCRITRESHFPSGVIRVATVALEFVETVQHSISGNEGLSTVQFIDRSSFQNNDYTFSGNGLYGL